MDRRAHRMTWDSISHLMLLPTARAPEQGGGGVTRGESERGRGRKYNIEERKSFSLGIEVKAGNVLSHMRKKTIRGAMSHPISIKDTSHHETFNPAPHMRIKVACLYSTRMILAWSSQNHAFSPLRDSSPWNLHCVIIYLPSSCYKPVWLFYFLLWFQMFLSISHDGKKIMT